MSKPRGRPRGYTPPRRCLVCGAMFAVPRLDQVLYKGGKTYVATKPSRRETCSKECQQALATKNRLAVIS